MEKVHFYQNLDGGFLAKVHLKYQGLLFEEDEYSQHILWGNSLLIKVFVKEKFWPWMYVVPNQQ